jgi:hypothetical protein
VVETYNVTVCNSDDLGLFHESVAATHFDLHVHDNAHVGVWAQRCESLEVLGVSMIERNLLAGVALVESGAAVLRDGEFNGSLAGVSLWSSLDSSEPVGDGIHVVRPAGSVRLENISMSDNERVGLLLTAYDEEWDDFVVEDVAVTGSGEELGAIAQGSAIPDGWDQAVTRTGTVVENDASHEGTLNFFQTVDDVVPNVEDILLYLDAL